MKKYLLRIVFVIWSCLFLAALIIGCSSDDSKEVNPNNRLEVSSGTRNTPLTTNGLPIFNLSLNEGFLLSEQEGDDYWIWVDNENIVSRDGSTGGYAVNFNQASTGLIIYLPGGRACFDAFSCSTNKPSYSIEDFAEAPFGALDRSSRAQNQANLLKDWTYVFLGYGSGDVYSGDNNSIDVPNGGDSDQTFQGFKNFQLAVQEVVSFLSDNGFEITDALLAGSSAGGYGVLGNFEQFAGLMEQFYPEAQLTLLNDAGYLLIDENVLPACLNQTWDETFNIQIPLDLATVSGNSFDFDFLNIYEYYSIKYPNSNFGFFGSYRDLTSRTLLSLGQGGCAYEVGLVNEEDFRNGLLIQQEDLLKDLPNWKVFYRDSEGHTILPTSEYQNLEVEGVLFQDWLRDLHNGVANDVIAL